MFKILRHLSFAKSEDFVCYRLLGTAKVPLMELTRGGPQSKDVDTILFDGGGQPLPQVSIVSDNNLV